MLQDLPRTIRQRPSIADESGGEEILYPRNLKPSGAEVSRVMAEASDDTPKLSRASERSAMPDKNIPTSPPTSFNQSSRKARKRSSDEFEMDQTGSLVSKYASPASATKDKPKDDKARRHRSLNLGSSARDTKGKDRRRESSGLTIQSNVKATPLTVKTSERHVRQTSASSTSSNPNDNVHSRRVHTTDFSHLPPSPSSSSIQQFLRNTASTNPPQPSSLHRSSKDNLQAHSSPSVAHSLLRGTQEGWSALDDEATAEALRKLDGLTGKGARARASVGSFRQPSNSSRPSTPASKSGSQWEGLSASDSGKSKRGSSNLKDRGDVGVEAGETSVIATSSDEQQQSQPSVDKTPKKSSVRVSFTPKRGSTSSTTYASTPSSRDSASMSAATSVTSMSNTSGRHSSSKGRRNSAGSDISSVHSTDAALKDRVASLALNGDTNDEGDVPPVPPLPKDLSSYRSPPGTSSGLAFPSMPSDDKDKASNHDSQPNHTISLEVPPYSSPIISPPASSEHRESQHYSSANESVPAVLKTPSKKWSFSNALNLKLSSPSSSSSQKSSFPLSPRSVTFGPQLRRSTSKDHPGSLSSAKGPWSPDQPEAMASAGSLTSMSSVGSVKASAQAQNQSRTPDRAPVLTSRPGTGSSASTNHTTSALAAPPPPTGALSPTSSMRRGSGQAKRLTPSSIPFFRRSSSQSMQMPPPTNGALSSTSPGAHSVSIPQPLVKPSVSPVHDYSSISTSTPGSSHKKSMLSLGLPSLLKSSSRRSLHADAKDAAKELQRAKDAARESEKEKAKAEKERLKKEEKDRSESRISVIINRKRGKVSNYLYS